MRSRVWSRLIPCALLLLPAAAEIPNPVHGAIQVYAALAGRFAFIQPDGTLTVLDATTGKVRFRGEKHIDERYTWSSFFDTPHGLVVRSYRWKLFTRDENVYRRLDFDPQTSAWEIASTRECHVGEDHLICPDWRGRLVAYELAGGREIWTYRPERPAGEVIDRACRRTRRSFGRRRRERRRHPGPAKPAAPGPSAHRGWRGTEHSPVRSGASFHPRAPSSSARRHAR